MPRIHSFGNIMAFSTYDTIPEYVMIIEFDGIYPEEYTCFVLHIDVFGCLSSTVTSHVSISL